MSTPNSENIEVVYKYTSVSHDAVLMINEDGQVNLNAGVGGNCALSVEQLIPIIQHACRDSAE